MDFTGSLVVHISLQAVKTIGKLFNVSCRQLDITFSRNSTCQLLTLCLDHASLEYG